MPITLEKEGRRYYLIGNTYPVKDQIKKAGCKWDPDRRAWWTGKKALAERLHQQLVPQETPSQEGTESVDLNAPLIRGRVQYKGKSYYLLAERRDGTAAKVCFRDGSKTFWTKQSAGYQVIKRYDNPKSINSLRDFAERCKRERTQEGSDVWCGERHRGRCCPTGGNCSSMGSGRSCGADCCDGY